MSISLELVSSTYSKPPPTLRWPPIHPSIYYAFKMVNAVIYFTLVTLSACSVLAVPMAYQFVFPITLFRCIHNMYFQAS